MVTTIGLLIIACVSPRHLMGTGWISWRFSIMASLAGMAMICPLPNLQRRQALLLGLALSCIVLGRTAWVGVNWWRGQSDVRDVETVLAAVPPGSAILPLMHLSGVTATMPSHRYFAWRENTFRHLPTLAVPYAHAFVPTIFTAQGKQPLTVLAPWSDIAVPEGNLFSTAIMSCHALMERDVMFTPYLSNWRRRFDFVLVVNADIADRYVGDFLPRGLTLAGDTPFAKLYAIDKTVVAAVQDQPGCPTDLSTIE
jgi:hypothetical protein